MNKKLPVILSSVLILSSLISSCENTTTEAKIYKDGMSYTETEKGTPEPYYALSYEIMGGDEVMPIGGFYAPYASGGSIDGHVLPDFLTDEYYQYISDCGINMFVYSVDRWSKGGENANLVKSLDLCEKYGIGYYIDSYWISSQLGSQTADYPIEDMIMKKGGTNAELKDLVNEISNNRTRKAFIGLLAFDEPFPSQLDNISVMMDAYYNLDNTEGTDVYMNSVGYWENVSNFWGYSDPILYEEYMETFFETVNPKMLSVTQYPYTSANTPESNLTGLMYNKLDAYRNYANKYHIPFWRMLQAGGQWNDAAVEVPSVDPYPSEGELLYDVNLALAYGAKSIQYFPLIEPLHFSYAPGGTYDFENRNGLIGADGNLTRWYYYAKRANTQVQAIDHVLMKSSNQGVIVHGKTARKAIVEDSTSHTAVLNGEKFRQLTSIIGDDCIVGCFDYKGGTALYVVNYSRTKKSDITLKFDRNDYLYEIIQRGVSCKVVGGSVPLRLDYGEGALIVLA